MPSPIPPPPINRKETPLEHQHRQSLHRRLTNSTLRTLTLPKTHMTDFSSNDFLSLSHNPRLKSLYLAELSSSAATQPHLPLGSGGSRLLDGNSAYAEALERDVAAFHGAEAGLLFNSGFDANAGFFACVPQDLEGGGFVVYDELIHASVHDGMRMSRVGRGRCRKFKHNCVESLREVLEGCLAEGEELREGRGSVVVAVEAVYSMDGDVAKLREIVEVVESTLPRGTGHVVVDEAHSTGVLGPQGRGLVCELGLEDRVFARLHTFGKALACNGAIILCSPLLRHYLINYARPLIYTTSLSYPALAAIRTSYKLLPLLGQQEGEEDPRTHLFNLISQLFTSLTALVDTESSSNADEDIRTLIQVPKTCPSSPIFAVQTPEPRQLAAFLQARGMMVRAVVAPTVAEGTERVRVCLHAGNTKVEVETLVGGIGEWARGRAKARARL